jgi:hypothetical protein
LYQFSIYGEKRIKQSDIKQILGYNSNDQRIDYIIKENGVLDKLGYTKTEKDFPIQTIYDWELKFVMYSELKDQDVKFNDRNFKIKKPIKAFYRDEDSYKEQIFDGTFYDVSDTHAIELDKFYKIVDQIGVNGFFVYGFMKYKCDKFKNYTRSIQQISEEIGLSERTVYKILGELKEFIDIQSNGYRMTNTYTMKS